MKSMNISFSPPDMSDMEIQEVADTIKSGWITTGPKTKELERQIAKYVGVNRCVCLNSQTACGEMALRVLGIGAGDEVIVPAYTYSASASIVDHVGAKIVFVDVQEGCLEMDYDKMEAAITEKTKAIIPVDLGGVPCDYDKILQLWKRKRLCSSLRMKFKRPLAGLLFVQILLMPLVQAGMARCAVLLPISAPLASMQ